MTDAPKNATGDSIPNVICSDDDNPVLTAVHSLNLVLGLPVNGYAAWLILSRAAGGGGASGPETATPTLVPTLASEFFFLNLIAAVVASPMASVFHFAWRPTVTRTLVILFYTSVPAFQCCVCAERYAAVVRPVAFLRYKALRYRVVCCGAVWTPLIAFSAGFAVNPSLITVGCSVSLGVHVACVSAVSYCCLSVLGALKRPGPGEGGQLQRGNGGGGAGSRSEGNGGATMKRRAFRIILISLIVMLLNIVICSANYLNLLFHVDLPHVYNYVTYALAAMSGFVHPLLYIHKAGRLPCFKEL